jgi:lipoprotein-anchoring transpeptidase ErfK/SrfK
MRVVLPGAAAFTGVVALALTAAAPARAASGTQTLAALLGPHALFAAPRVHPRRVGGVRAYRPITGGQTVLPVVGRARTRNGVRWLRVMVPGRPNGRRAWISQSRTQLASTTWRLSVSRSVRRVYVYHRGRLLRSLSAIVGKPSTPTPRGRFFVEESIRMPSGAAGAPYALALSARSNVLQEFEGGPGQIAIHGIANLGGRMGTAASHGCVRLNNRSVSWLARRIVPGTRVTIR